MCPGAQTSFSKLEVEKARKLEDTGNGKKEQKRDWRVYRVNRLSSQSLCEPVQRLDKSGTGEHVCHASLPFTGAILAGTVQHFNSAGQHSHLIKAESVGFSFTKTVLGNRNEHLSANTHAGLVGFEGLQNSQGRQTMSNICRQTGRWQTARHEIKAGDR